MTEQKIRAEVESLLACLRGHEKCNQLPNGQRKGTLPTKGRKNISVTTCSVLGNITSGPPQPGNNMVGRALVEATNDGLA